MTKLLHVVGSPRGAQSRSEAVARAFLAEARRLEPGLELETIDLWREDLPEFDGDKAAAKMAVITGRTLEGGARTAWDVITAIARRFTAADRYLFSVPMWNGGIPYRLKLYIDILTQPGLLFGFDPAAGYAPVLRHKHAAVIYTSGVFAPGVAPAFGRDFHSSYFDWWLRFIGISEIAEIRLQPSLLTADPAAALAAAEDAARAAAARLAALPRAA